MKLAKVYEPGEYEADIYALWERSGAFIADPDSKKERFTISMPPPNETGTLGVHHAIFLTLQDIMIRHARQKGKDALWVPGTDHAALAVNALMEKKLAEEGTDKHEIGREEFLRRTREFVGNSRDTMIAQMRAMGASADWTRMRYTLDESLNRAVNEVFMSMYNDGLIYRGNRIVNWDPNLQTTVSDDEVMYQEEKGEFYTLQYGPFRIGTARPETKFGDKYVVMHPDDLRYRDYKHGDTFEAEWINGPVTATVIKDTAIDPEFGTGVMTITPWHSHVDFEVAERHNLDRTQIIDFHGKLLPIAGEFAGQEIGVARAGIVEKLKKKGLMLNVDKEYVHNIAVNDRGKGVIEPQIRLQWFVDVNRKAVKWKGKKHSLKEVMQAVINDGDIKIVPKRFEKLYFHWVNNLHDWCLSRQIWWGHRIPVWYRTDADGKEEIYVGLTPPDDESEGFREWEQDPDTLDTWFSSSLWTWSTLLDPALTSDTSLELIDLLAKSKDYQAYHPTTVMETGMDILPIWVAKMILSTTYATGQVPFKTVFLHGMIRTTDGKKMSKSRPESIIDPLEIIEKYGTDAMRLALVMGVSPGNDQSWSTDKVEANRNFNNKLWNIARYYESLSEGRQAGEAPEARSAADHWILKKLSDSIDSIDKSIEKFDFSGAYNELYHLTWDDFADWYIESSKHSLNYGVLTYGLETILKLAHPFAPFVTETIWQTLNPENDNLLITTPWPKSVKHDVRIAKEFEQLQVIIGEIRQIKTMLRLKYTALYYKDSPLIKNNSKLVVALARLDEIKPAYEAKGLRLTQTPVTAWIDVDEDVARRFLDKLLARREELKKQDHVLVNRLGNPAYIKKAPKKLVEESKQQQKDLQSEVEAIEKQLKQFDFIYLK